MFAIGQPSKNAVMVVNMSAWCGRKSRIEWIAADDTFWEDGRIHFMRVIIFKRLLKVMTGLIIDKSAAEMFKI